MSQRKQARILALPRKAWLSVTIGGAIGLALGLIVTLLYGRVTKFSRHPRPASL